MENLLVIKEIGSEGDFDSMASLEDLAVGQAVIVGDGRKILGLGSTPADYADIKDIMFVVGLGGGRVRNTVSIPRRNITNFNGQIYTSPQNKIMRIGGITAELALALDNDTEANITVKNLSYNHAIATQTVHGSFTKHASESDAVFMARVAAELNASPGNVSSPFFTATVVTAGGFFGLTFETTDENVDLAVMVNGMWDHSTAVTIQQAKMAFGKGSDILQMEKDMSRHRGNNNYVEINDAWYSANMLSSASENYNVATLFWDGIAPHGATSKMVAGVNTLTIAVPVTYDFSAIVTAINRAVNETYTVVGGAEVGVQDNPDGTDGDLGT